MKLQLISNALFLLRLNLLNILRNNDSMELWKQIGESELHRGSSFEKIHKMKHIYKQSLPEILLAICKSRILSVRCTVVKLIVRVVRCYIHTESRGLRHSSAGDGALACGACERCYTQRVVGSSPVRRASIPFKMSQNPVSTAERYFTLQWSVSSLNVLGDSGCVTKNIRKLYAGLAKDRKVCLTITTSINILFTNLLHLN